MARSKSSIEMPPLDGSRARSRAYCTTRRTSGASMYRRMVAVGVLSASTRRASESTPRPVVSKSCSCFKNAWMRSDCAAGLGTSTACMALRKACTVERPSSSHSTLRSTCCICQESK
eukprot:scaffold8243_cov129-Isochrysis_galbana.AAC.10